MEQHYTIENILLFTLYGGIIVLSLAASLYLLLRPYNALSHDITPPVRLRRWAATLLASVGISHLWWLSFIMASRTATSSTVSCSVQLLILGLSYPSLCAPC